MLKIRYWGLSLSAIQKPWLSRKHDLQKSQMADTAHAEAILTVGSDTGSPSETKPKKSLSKSNKKYVVTHQSKF